MLVAVVLVCYMRSYASSSAIRRGLIMKEFLPDDDVCVKRERERERESITTSGDNCYISIGFYYYYKISQSANLISAAE